MQADLGLSRDNLVIFLRSVTLRSLVAMVNSSGNVPEAACCCPESNRNVYLHD